MMHFAIGDWFLLILLSLPILATLLPLVNHDFWLFRIFDFPRLQIAALSLLCVILNYYFQQTNSPIFTLFEVLNFACFAYQLKEIAAYTRLTRPEVVVSNAPDDDNTISLLTTNVLTPNRQADKLLSLIDSMQPDVVLTLETDQWWETQLAPLEHQKGYQYTVKIPLDNLYGMHLYSRFPLKDVEIRHWVQEDIPSITAHLQLPSGKFIRIYCLHPMPPSPTEADTSTGRDAELLLVGKEIEANNQSVLVFGDLNDVAWSRTSRLFQQISGLLDPRKGRGLYNTFHAKYPLLRWPLDHIFHSNDFMMKEIKVLPGIGSDHFPVYGKFQYEPAAEAVQEETQANREEQAEANEKIAAANPEKDIIGRKY